MTTALLWYRRDLRLADHPALTRATREFDRVVCVFVLHDALRRGRFASAPREAFMLGCLRALDEALRERGSRLVIRAGRPEHELVELAAEVGAGTVLWTSDVSPYARARDRRVSDALRSAGVRPLPQGGNYVVDVARPRTQGGMPFTMFSPFHKHWRATARRAIHPAPAGIASPSEAPGAARVAAPPPDGALAEAHCEPGETVARRALSAWLDGPIDAYARLHDAVGCAGTSGLSAYLRWGCLSPAECEARAAQRGGAGAQAWIRQLCWRDFFAHVLLAHPDNARLEHQPRYRALEWDEDGEAFDAWRLGRTGYPLVDAAMRQLARTGWMHNRARMVAGSFLTKDLHLDWRLGERHFEALLLDGEPAQNNGNWQWVASVGVDPAPYFRRLFNPILQQRKFDPDGVYVRRWVPELRDVAAARLAEPWRMSEAQQAASGCVIGRDYPAPIVDHAEERRRAIERYRAAGNH